MSEGVLTRYFDLVRGEWRQTQPRLSEYRGKPVPPAKNLGVILPG
jgi:hypothetical protein